MNLSRVPDQEHTKGREVQKHTKNGGKKETFYYLMTFEFEFISMPGAWDMFVNPKVIIGTKNEKRKVQIVRKLDDVETTKKSIKQQQQSRFIYFFK